MQRMFRQLQLLRDVSQRLAALADARGIAQNVSGRLQEESQALTWAYEELLQLHTVEALVVVCPLGSSPVEVVGEKAAVRGLEVISVFEPGDYAKEIHSKLVGDSWQGNQIVEVKLSFGLWCDRYFAYRSKDKPGSCALLMHPFLSKKWVDQVGLDGVKVTLSNWSASIFEAIKWDQAREV